jgi:phosphoserine phosphatase
MPRKTRAHGASVATAISAAAIFFSLAVSPLRAADPLPSWNDGAAKRAVVTFVQEATRKGGTGYIPPEERIATLDNDGTLWGEKPRPVQLAFIVDRVKALAPQHPEWKGDASFAALIEDDLEVLLADEKAALRILTAAHADMTTEEFERVVTSWIATARHPKTGKLYTEMVYQPMLELLDYLRQSGFKTYIVSGGGAEFMRPWAEKVYGIPPEQVIGSRAKTKYEIQNGRPVLIKQREIEFVDDKAGKPVGIHASIGRRPVAAFGNSDGDLQMLEWTGAGGAGRLMLLVHHDDADREYAYDKGAEKALGEAATSGWTVVSMKKDWKVIYPQHKK